MDRAGHHGSAGWMPALQGLRRRGEVNLLVHCAVLLHMLRYLVQLPEISAGNAQASRIIAELEVFAVDYFGLDQRVSGSLRSCWVRCLAEDGAEPSADGERRRRQPCYRRRHCKATAAQGHHGNVVQPVPVLPGHPTPAGALAE